MVGGLGDRGRSARGGRVYGYGEERRGRSGVRGGAGVFLPVLGLERASVAEGDARVLPGATAVVAVVVVRGQCGLDPGGARSSCAVVLVLESVPVAVPVRV
jgi:hypothetical protein